MRQLTAAALLVFASTVSYAAAGGSAASQPNDGLGGSCGHYAMDGANAQQTSCVDTTILADGGKAWTFDVPGGNSIEGGSAVSKDGNSHYFATAEGTLYRVDASRLTYGIPQAFSPGGTVVWTQKLKGGVSRGVAPTLSGDEKTLYIGTQANRFVAIDAATGNWSAAWKEPVSTAGPISSSATISGDMIYFGDKHYDMYGVNATDGTVLFRCGALAPINGAPAVSRDGKKLFFTSMDTNVYQLTVATASQQCAGNPPNSVSPNCCIPSMHKFGTCGDQFTPCADWAISVAGTSIEEPVVVDEDTGTLFVTAPGAPGIKGGAFAFDMATAPNGEPVRISNCSGSPQGATTLGPGMVYTSCDKDFMGYKRLTHGGFELAFNFVAESNVENTAVSNMDIVVFSTANGVMHGLNATSGAEIFKEQLAATKGVAEGQPLVNSYGEICVGTQGGQFTCVGESTNINAVRVILAVCVLALLVLMCICYRAGCASETTSKGKADEYTSLAGDAPAEGYGHA